MATYYINSGNGSFWTPGTVYNIGDIVCSRAEQTDDDKRCRVYECTTGGTSHATTEPTWNYFSVGNTTNDNNVVWTTRAPTTWDLAHPSLILFLSKSSYHALGDIIKVHDAHNEVVASGDAYNILNSAGTYNNPVKVVCVDKDNADALSTGAVVACQRAIKIFVNYITSINIKWIFSGDTTRGSGCGVIFIGDGTITVLELDGASNSFLGEGDNDSASLEIYNGNVELNNAANILGLTNGILIWKNGTLIAPNGSTYVFNMSSVYNKKLLVEDVDLTAVGAGTLINVTNSEATVADFIRCKLPSNLSAISSAFNAVGNVGKINLHSCSYDKLTYGFTESSAEGIVGDETSIVRTGGASDGITPISWKMVSSAGVNEFGPHLETPSINIWNESTSEITLTIHGIIDSATNLQSDEVWIEVSYPKDATSGLGALETSRIIYGSITDLAASTETWAESMANPNKFKLTATFTPAQAGPITARVCVGKASTTLYICPKAVIS